jgi:hypothetical protein
MGQQYEVHVQNARNDDSVVQLSFTLPFQMELSDPG